MYFSHILAITAIILLSISLFFEFKRNLLMFQQNSYRPERYKKWLENSGESTSFIKLFGIFLALFGLAAFGVIRFVLIAYIIYAIVVSAKLGKQKYKKPLVVTNRIKRLSISIIFITFIIVGAVVLLSLNGMFGKPRALFSICITLLFVLSFSNVIIFLSYYLCKPLENRINKKFYEKAKAKLESLPNLKVIGVTGSYGKTSTKHFLHAILSEHYETLMTPGSFNTTLGVVRTINEYLKPYHQAFIVEMGAKQPKDIEEICRLVNPEYGILTSVGPQHLETFGTIENVRNTKFELIDSLPSSGWAILNNDYPMIAMRDVENCNVLRYSCLGKDNNINYYAHNVHYSSQGTSFTLEGPDNFSEDFQTQLLGEYNIANLTAAIAASILLEIPLSIIKYAVARIEPVEHRLSLRPLPSGILIIDDAYNSNPVGSQMAVEVLAEISRGKSIIITPGMIELGEKQFELNAKLGQHIAEKNIDYVVIVGQYNKEAILTGLERNDYPTERILYFDTFNEANAWMIAFCNPGDTVLIENDLPDTFK